MKIALLGTAYPYRGGLASYNERLASEFMKQGHEVIIYTFSLQYPDFLFPGKTQFSDEPSPKGLHILRRINSMHPLNWLKVGNQIGKSKPDMVIVNYWLPLMGPCFGTIMRRVKRNKHSKIIALIHNMIPHESRPGDAFFSRYFVKPVDGFLAMSESVIQEIEHFDHSKPKTLSPHPLFDNFGPRQTRENALQKLGFDPDYRYVLFFGLVRKYKGLDLLLKAFSDARLRKLNIKLLIAGEYYDDRKIYQNLIRELHLSDHIIEIDRFIQDTEVKYYFGAADLVVQPYKSATQSGVTQIAYHFNTPMVVTHVGGLPELCPDGKVGYVVSVDSKSIASAIYRFFSEEKQAVFEANIPEEKKKFSWDILVKNFFNLWESL
jgi:D-inositol-3-phosphate glycosyltransferase